MIRSLRIVALLWTCVSLLAQDSQPTLKVTKLGKLTYPPIAVAARVSGEVRLQVKLSPDGIASEVTVKSGPQMLRQAALESATQTRFEPFSEGSSSGTRLLIYRFDLEFAKECDAGRDSSYPRIKYEGNVISVAEQPFPTCDPSTTIEKVRGIKCLYLWKCSSKSA